jgi:hypothetical protein
MPRPVPAVNQSLDAQAALHSLRHACAPLWQAALASGDWSLLSESHALAGTLRTAGTQLRRISGQLERIECPDGRAHGSHGRAS